MDVVDVDKLLDDLEASEAAANSSRAKVPNWQNQTKLEFTNGLNSSPVEHHHNGSAVKPFPVAHNNFGFVHSFGDHSNANHDTDLLESAHHEMPLSNGSFANHLSEDDKLSGVVFDEIPCSKFASGSVPVTGLLISVSDNEKPDGAENGQSGNIDESEKWLDAEELKLLAKSSDVVCDLDNAKEISDLDRTEKAAGVNNLIDAEEFCSFSMEANRNQEGLKIEKQSTLPCPQAQQVEPASVDDLGDGDNVASIVVCADLTHCSIATDTRELVEGSAPVDGEVTKSMDLDAVVPADDLVVKFRPVDDLSDVSDSELEAYLKDLEPCVTADVNPALSPTGHSDPVDRMLAAATLTSVSPVDNDLIAVNGASEDNVCLAQRFADSEKSVPEDAPGGRLEDATIKVQSEEISLDVGYSSQLPSTAELLPESRESMGTQSSPKLAQARDIAGSFDDEIAMSASRVSDLDKFLSLQKQVLKISSASAGSSNAISENDVGSTSTAEKAPDLSNGEVPGADLDDEAVASMNSVTDASNMDVPAGGDVVPDLSMVAAAVSVAQSSTTRAISVSIPTGSLIASTHDMGARWIPKLTAAEMELGKSPPAWIPDQDSAICMLCLSKFNVIKRRHHCRACGRVLCAECCNEKAKLQYMENKEARVCIKCSQTLSKVELHEKALERQQSAADTAQAAASSFATASTSEASASVDGAAASVIGGPDGHVAAAENSANKSASGDATAKDDRKRARGISSALKRDDSIREQKQVMFSDGIKPGGDLSEETAHSSAPSPSFPPPPLNAAAGTSSSSATGRRPSKHSHRRSKAHPVPPPSSSTVQQRELACFIPSSGTDFPPASCVTATGTTSPSTTDAFKDLLNFDCCLNKTVWCFASTGFCFVGQDEVLFVLEASADEQTPPLDVLRYYNWLYDQAIQDAPLSELSHSLFATFGPSGFLDCKDCAGFLYIKPTFQCLKKLNVPTTSFLIGLLIMRWEIPWAKVLPLRLMLRLGAEYQYYPCPVVSYRNRRALFFELGHTIMSLLADFRSYTYTLPIIAGAVVRFLDDETVLMLPTSEYKHITKVLNSSNEHVLAFGVSFDREADGQLVCVQQESGAYQSQIITRQDRSRKITGASFIVFNGSLKSGDSNARSSIVEDGVMVQMKPEIMETLKEKLRSQDDYFISCDTGEEQFSLVIQWFNHSKVAETNGPASPIDLAPLSHLQKISLPGRTGDSHSDSCIVRLNEVFVHENGENNSLSDAGDIARLSRILAAAAQSVLVPVADQLAELNLRRIGLRITLSPDLVEYIIGANGTHLPAVYVEALDNALVPVIHEHAANFAHTLIVELILYILDL